jgi:hypothetical protein
MIKTEEIAVSPPLWVPLLTRRMDRQCPTHPAPGVPARCKEYHSMNGGAFFRPSFKNLLSTALQANIKKFEEMMAT